MTVARHWHASKQNIAKESERIECRPQEAHGVKETYRAHRIEVRSLPSGEHKWRTEVYIWRSTDRQIMRAKLPPPPSEWAAATKEEADQYGLTQGRAWIDLFA